MIEWFDNLTGFQMTAALGAAWLAVAVVFGLAVSQFWPDLDDDCDDECSMRIMRDGECRHDRRREVNRGR